MKLTEVFRKFYDDGGIFKPTGRKEANELYDEMLQITVGLCANPHVIDLALEIDVEDQAERVIQLAHSIAINAKTMHLSLLEEAQKRYDNRIDEEGNSIEESVQGI